MGACLWVCVYTLASACTRVACVCVRVHVCARVHMTRWETFPRHFWRLLSPVFPAAAGTSWPRYPSVADTSCGSAQEAAGHVWTHPSSETSLCPGRGEGTREGPKGLWGDTWAFPHRPVLLGRVSGPLSADTRCPRPPGLEGWCGFLLPELRPLWCPGHAGFPGGKSASGGWIVDSHGRGSGGGGAGPFAEAAAEVCAVPSLWPLL